MELADQDLGTDPGIDFPHSGFYENHRSIFNRSDIKIHRCVALCPFNFHGFLKEGYFIVHCSDNAENIFLLCHVLSMLLYNHTNP